MRRCYLNSAVNLLRLDAQFAKRSQVVIQEKEGYFLKIVGVPSIKYSARPLVVVCFKLSAKYAGHPTLHNGAASRSLTPHLWRFQNTHLHTIDCD